MQRTLLSIVAIFLLACGMVCLTACSTSEEEDPYAPSDTLDEGDDDDIDPGPGGGDDDDDTSGDDDTAGDDDSAGGDDDDSVDSSGPCDGLVESRRIVYTTWEDLSTTVRADFIGAFGEEFAAKIFYARFVYWYAVARELMDASRAFYRFDDDDYPQERWDAEVLAAEMTVSYYRSRGETNNIAEFHAGTVTMHGSLTAPPIPGTSDPETFFRNNEESILGNAPVLLWYQTYWAKEAVTTQMDPNFNAMVDEYLCEAIDESVALAFQQPHVSFDENLPPLVWDAFESDLATWSMKLNPSLELSTGTPTGLAEFR
ncbi:MAG: hypothetical protein P9L99_21235 [Candidatus Lernaella stagnicola]|nr:hypothetical protein [Candidatus Lernaella stagnicola]